MARPTTAVTPTVGNRPALTRGSFNFKYIFQTKVISSWAISLLFILVISCRTLYIFRGVFNIHNVSETVSVSITCKGGGVHLSWAPFCLDHWSACSKDS
jgi:uncharacterized membrane protein (UPF0182 family)